MLKKHHEGKQFPSQEPVVSETLGSLASYLIPQKIQNFTCPIGHCILCPSLMVCVGGSSLTRATRPNLPSQRAQRLDKRVPGWQHPCLAPVPYFGGEEMGHQVNI